MHLITFAVLILEGLATCLAGVTSDPSSASGKTFDYIVVRLLHLFLRLCAIGPITSLGRRWVDGNHCCSQARREC
jgi:hypothetical protein